MIELIKINSLPAGSIFKLTIIILLILFHIYLCLIDKPLFSKDYQNKNLYLEAGPGNNMGELHKIFATLSVYGSLVGLFLGIQSRNNELNREDLEKEIAKAKMEKQKYFEELQERNSENSALKVEVVSLKVAVQDYLKGVTGIEEKIIKNTIAGRESSLAGKPSDVLTSLVLLKANGQELGRLKVEFLKQNPNLAKYFDKSQPSILPLLEGINLRELNNINSIDVFKNLEN